jgi:BMFP domain-containing protein YqiC|tara:strand:- start:556 stop:816 length:261 start_codon:yes stop_codon:yes gene_type:complete
MDIDMLKEKIETAISDITKILPEDLDILKDDLEKNIRATLNATFSKMELVTREEFDIQASLLSRTRAKLEALQKKLSEIEKQLEEK